MKRRPQPPAAPSFSWAFFGAVISMRIDGRGAVEVAMGSAVVFFLGLALLLYATFVRRIDALERRVAELERERELRPDERLIAGDPWHPQETRYTK